MARHPSWMPSSSSFDAHRCSPVHAQRAFRPTCTDAVRCRPNDSFDSPAHRGASHRVSIHRWWVRGSRWLQLTRKAAISMSNSSFRLAYLGAGRPNPCFDSRPSKTPQPRSFDSPTASAALPSPFQHADSRPGSRSRVSTRAGLPSKAVAAVVAWFQHRGEPRSAAAALEMIARFQHAADRTMFTALKFRHPGTLGSRRQGKMRVPPMGRFNTPQPFGRGRSSSTSARDRRSRFVSTRRKCRADLFVSTRAGACDPSTRRRRSFDSLPLPCPPPATAGSDSIPSLAVSSCPAFVIT